jgi:SAM-dependent methyltransferase
MKFISGKLFSLLKRIIYILLVRNSKKNRITFSDKIKLYLIHTFYSNYQPMNLEKWTKKSSKRNVDDRLNLIEEQLKGHSVLDIGSHSGYFSLKLAQKGYFVLGVDQDKIILNKANLVQKKYDINNASFLYYPITIESVKKIPYFDNIIYLSIHHHMIKVHGFEVATEIFKILAQKTKYNLFFDFPYPEAYSGNPLFEDKIPYMGDDPDLWLKKYLLEIGFNKVDSLQVLSHNEKPDETRNLFMAKM